jgi:hypothetical protein
MKPLMSGQVLRGTYLSASSGAHSAPAQRPTSTAPAAGHNLLGHVEAEAADDLLGVALAAAVDHLTDAAGVQVRGNAVQIGMWMRGLFFWVRNMVWYISPTTPRRPSCASTSMPRSPHILW